MALTLLDCQLVIKWISCFRTSANYIFTKNTATFTCSIFSFVWHTPFCIHLIISLFRHWRSTQRNCCGSSSFWRSFWRGPGHAVVSHLQHVQACCLSWLTQCARGPSETCWWCQLASPMTALLRETTIVSSWWVSGWRRWQQRCFLLFFFNHAQKKKNTQKK